MARAVAGVVVGFLLAIIAAHVAYKATAHGAAEPVNEPWAQQQMNFVAWNSDRWTAWIFDDAFVQVPKSAGDRSRHENRSVAFLDWQGEPWQAKIDGETFLLARRGDWQKSTTHADAIRYLDWSGEKQLRTVAQLRRE